MHTPDQARTLWCPMARVNVHDEDYPDQDAITQVSCNRFFDPGKNQTNVAGCQCLGPACACWRWLPDADYALYVKPGTVVEDKDKLGSCGLIKG